MFTRIRLKNYKSLVDFSVNFLQKKGGCKESNNSIWREWCWEIKFCICFLYTM